MMTASPPRIVGFETYLKRYICRDPYCLKMMEVRGDSIVRIVRHVLWNRVRCDMCKEPLRAKLR